MLVWRCKVSYLLTSSERLNSSDTAIRHRQKCGRSHLRPGDDVTNSTRKSPYIHEPTRLAIKRVRQVGQTNMSGCTCCPQLQTPKPLQPVVETIWISNPRADFECEVVPDGSVDLCFSCSDRDVSLVLLGPATRFSTFKMKAGVFHICVRFRPGVPLYLIGNRKTEADFFKHMRCCYGVFVYDQT